MLKKCRRFVRQSFSSRNIHRNRPEAVQSSKLIFWSPNLRPQIKIKDFKSGADSIELGFYQPYMLTSACANEDGAKRNEAKLCICQRITFQLSI